MNKDLKTAIGIRDSQWKHAKMIGAKYGVNSPVARSARRIWAVYVKEVEHLVNGGTRKNFELPDSAVITAIAKEADEFFGAEATK